MNQYYSSQKAFIEKTIADCALGKLTVEEKLQLETIIAKKLSERVIETIVENFSPEELAYVQALQKKYPDSDAFEMVMQVGENMPGIEEKLMMSLEILRAEIVFEMQEIHRLIKNLRKI